MISAFLDLTFMQTRGWQIFMAILGMLILIGVFFFVFEGAEAYLRWMVRRHHAKARRQRQREMAQTTDIVGAYQQAQKEFLARRTSR